MSDDRAKDELRVAQAILLDASAPPQAAAEHLQRAADLLGGRVLEQRDHGEPAGTSDPHEGAASRRALLKQLAELEARLARRGREPLPLRWRWAFRAVGWLGGLAIVVALWRATGDDIAPGKWRARYFATPNLAGEPIERRESDVNFRWNQRRPLRSLERDHFSVTFETCLRTWKPRQVRFQIVANNGARLTVDGDVLVDETASSRVTAGPVVALDAGLHHLRLDYVERTGRAEVVLRASLDGSVPRALNPDRLDYPRPGATPCPPE